VPDDPASAATPADPSPERTTPVADRRATLAAAAVVAALGLGLGLTAAWRPRLTLDSLEYALVTREVRAGRGLRTPVVRLRDDAAPRPGAAGTVPFTAQPPLVPLAWAALGGVAPGRTAAVTVLNALAHAVAALAAFAIALRLGGGAGPGLAAGAAAAIASPGLELARHGLSEPLFTALLTGAVAALVQARASPRPRRWLALAGAAAAGAVATRYAGAALLAVAAWEAARVARGHGRRAALERLGLVVAAPALVLGGLVVRNLAHTGHARGYLQPEGVRSLPGAGLDLLGRLVGQVGLGEPVAAAAVLLLAVVPPAVLLARARRAGPDRAPGPGFDLALVAALAYLGLLAWALTGEPRVEPRYAAPVIPVGVALAVATVVAGYRTVASQPARVVGGAVGLALLVAPLAADAWRGLRSLAAAPAQDLRAFRERPTLRWIRAHLPADALVVTNQPVLTATFGERATVALPTRWWSPRDPLPDDMAAWLTDLAADPRARHVVLFADRRGLDPGDWGPFVARLARREEVPGWKRVHEAPDGVVYAVPPP